MKANELDTPQAIVDQLAEDDIVLTSAAVDAQRLRIQAPAVALDAVREAANETNVLRVTSESADSIEYALTADELESFGAASEPARGAAREHRAPHASVSPAALALQHDAEPDREHDRVLQERLCLWSP